jgi:hypothetical protein
MPTNPPGYMQNYRKQRKMDEERQRMERQQQLVKQAERRREFELEMEKERLNKLKLAETVVASSKVPQEHLEFLAQLYELFEKCQIERLNDGSGMVSVLFPEAAVRAMFGAPEDETDGDLTQCQI